MLLSVQKDYRDVIAHLTRAYCRRTLISCVGNRVEEVQTTQRRLVDISAISHVFYHDSRLSKLTVQLSPRSLMLLAKLSPPLFLCILQIDRMLMVRAEDTVA